jgi:hypothetical protein
MNAKLALATAQALSMAVFVIIARWYLVPWMKTRDRAEALTPLLWLHVFRYVALQGFSAQMAGFPISNSARDEILYGDLTGMALAAAALFALRHKARIAIPLVWVMVAETITDTVVNAHAGMQEHLYGLATGLTWLVVSCYVPAIMVSLGLLIWQLYSRRGQPLERIRPAPARDLNPRPVAVAR